MSQALNNPTGVMHCGYGAMATTSEISLGPGLSHREFMNIGEYITQNLCAINSSSNQLRRTLLLIGTPKDSSALRDGLHKVNAKTRITLEMTLLELHRITMAAQHGNLEQKNYVNYIADLSYNMIDKFVALQKQLAMAIRQSFQHDDLGEQHTEQHRLYDAEHECQLSETDIIDVERWRNKIEQSKRYNTENGFARHLSMAEHRIEVESPRNNRHTIILLLVIILLVGSIAVGIILCYF